MRSFRHWTPRYVWDRLNVMKVERQNPDAPWLTASAISILSTWLKSSDIGFEWGSGRSTVWFAKRVARVISVEHDLEWARSVPDMLKRTQVEGRVAYRTVSESADENGNFAYVDVIKEAPDLSLDFCLVDGMLRDRCALACLDKLKSGGLLIIDNVNWYLPREPVTSSPGSRTLLNGPASELWDDFQRHVAQWRHIWTTNGVTDTAFWIKQ